MVDDDDLFPVQVETKPSEVPAPVKTTLGEALRALGETVIYGPGRQQAAASYFLRGAMMSREVEVRRGHWEGGRMMVPDSICWDGHCHYTWPPKRSREPEGSSF